MRSIKTSSLVRRVLAVSLGLAFSAPAVYAGNIGDTYSTSTTLTVGIMNNIKNAVNDNDTRITTNTNAITTLNTTVGGHTTSITTLQGQVSALQAPTSSTTCTPAAGDDAGGMVRVGSVCVDKYLARLGGTIGNCTGDGVDNGATCNIVAQSTAAGTAIKADAITWAQAARACANAGKRLLTAGEWVAARAIGQLDGIANSSLEFIDQFATPAATQLSSQVAYIGPNAGGTVVVGRDATYNAVVGGGTFIGFRCAR